MLSYPAWAFLISLSEVSICGSRLVFANSDLILNYRLNAVDPIKRYAMIPKVLIVDDEINFTEVLAKRLTMRDYHVQTCFSGKEAVAKIQHGNIDVVILDVAMPEMDGIETLRKIKRIKPLAEVLMLTGHATVESAIEGMKLGARDFLLKPCEIEELDAKINDAYKHKKHQEEKITEARMKELISSPHAIFRK